MAVVLFIMSAVLGISTFAIGMLPLLYAFSSSSSRSVKDLLQYIYYIEIESHLERLSALGTGLLLGAALGVIIPEYVQLRVFSLQVMRLFTRFQLNQRNRCHCGGSYRWTANRSHFSVSSHWIHPHVNHRTTNITSFSLALSE